MRGCEMGDKAMRVLIADDRPEVRSAIRLLLRQQPGVIVVGEAANTEQALRATAGQGFDLVLLDWELPGQDRTPALVGLRAARPGLAVVALSGRPEARREALGAGADLFVSKGDPPERLLAAVDECKRGCG